MDASRRTRPLEHSIGSLSYSPGGVVLEHVVPAAETVSYTHLSITDADGTPRPHEVDEEDGEFIMTSRADTYVHGEQTYVFRYRLHNVTRAFQNTGVDEFYWQVNGLQWPQSFGRVAAMLHLDDDLAESLTGASACYRGYADSTERCEICLLYTSRCV